MRYLTIAGLPAAIAKIREADSTPDVTFGATTSTKSSSDALDTPMSAADLMEALQLVTVMVSTAGGVIALAERVVDLVKKIDGRQEVVISDPKNPKDSITVTPSTKSNEIADKIQRFPQ